MANQPSANTMKAFNARSTAKKLKKIAFPSAIFCQ